MAKNNRKGVKMTHLPASPDTIDKILEDYAFETDGEMDCGHDGNFDKAQAKAKLESLLVEAQIRFAKSCISGPMQDGFYTMSKSEMESRIHLLEAEHLKLKEQL